MVRLTTTRPCVFVVDLAIKHSPNRKTIIGGVLEFTVLALEFTVLAVYKAYLPLKNLKNRKFQIHRNQIEVEFRDDN